MKNPEKLLDKADQRYMEHMLRDKLEEGLKRGMKRGIKAGRQEGIQEGRKEQAFESARSLRAQGILTDEQIAYALNLSLETIKAL